MCLGMYTCDFCDGQADANASVSKRHDSGENREP